ncbi:MAG: hypothetical protein ACE5E8_03030, partial [Acidimicrobiia bacterium]
GWLRTVRVAGAVSAAGGFGLVIFGIWGEPGASVYWKSTATLLVVAAAAGLLGILSHAVLPSKQRWVGASAPVLIGIVAVYGLVLMWVDSEAQWSWRIFGIAGVLLAAAVVAVPVLHSTESRQVSGGGLPIRFCPFCGAGAVGTLGAATGCPSCGRAFVVGPAG